MILRRTDHTWRRSGIRRRDFLRLSAATLACLPDSVRIAFGSGAQVAAVERAVAETGNGWSRFRGPNGTGIAAGAGYPTDFADSRNMLWKRRVHRGKSSPVLTADCVFLSGEDGETLVISCLDRMTGKTRWEQSLTAGRREFRHPLNTPAVATPVTNGRDLFTFFPDFGLISHDRDGKERWRMPLGPFSAAWGMASSPILVDDSVVLLLDGFKESYLAAFDERTGKERWRTARFAFALNYSTPVVRDLGAGRSEIVVLGPRRAVGYDPGSGKEHWSVKVPGGTVVPSPVLADGTLVSLTFSIEEPPSFTEQLQLHDVNKDGRISDAEIGNGESDRPLQMFAKFNGNNDGVITEEEWKEGWREMTGPSTVLTLRVPDGSDATPQTGWSYLRNVPRVSSPLLYRGLLYLVTDGGIMTSLHAASGQPTKVARLSGAIDKYFASPVAADGHIYLLSESGRLVVLRADPEWEVIHVNDIGEGGYATPALSDGKVYIRTSESLSCFWKPA
jgi:outer membrane protein assembly factor BamB